MESAEKLLENPIVKIVASFGFLLLLHGLVRNLLFGLMRLTNQFEFGAFQRWWNLDRLSWITIFIVLGIWAVVTVTSGFDQTLIIIVSGLFFVWSVFVRNIVFEFNFLTELLLVVEPILGLAGLALAFVTLSRFKGPMDLTEVAGNLNLNLGQTATAAPTGVTARPASDRPAPGWFPDPKGEAELRWWDGSQWTDNTN